MLKQSVLDGINEQIKNEFYSAYVYLSMSAYFDERNLAGFAHWTRVQSQEEVGHSMRLFDYLIDRGGKPVLQAIDKPPADFSSPLQVMERALEHEQKVTGMIDTLYELAFKEHDFATQAQLQWFITEQVEEEKSAGTIVEQLKMIGDNRTALLMLDMELGKRGAVPATA
jgi:ferritin